MSSCILAFDFGTKRIGAAAGSLQLLRARPLFTIESRCGKMEQAWLSIDRLVDHWCPYLLVVGAPDAQNTPRHFQILCNRFSQELARRSKLPVDRCDENDSSSAALLELRERRSSGELRRPIRKKDIDCLAAAHILDRWFAARS